MGLDWKKEMVYKGKELNSHRISWPPFHCYWSINMAAQSKHYEKLLCFSTFSNMSPILHHSSESVPAKGIKRVQFKVR